VQAVLELLLLLLELLLVPLDLLPDLAEGPQLVARPHVAGPVCGWMYSLWKLVMKFN
jgi:hypothetical protein